MFLSILFLLSCSNENYSSEDKDKQLTPLHIGNISFSQNSTLRSLEVLDKGDIGIFRMQSPGYSGVQKNVHYVCKKSFWDVSGEESDPVYLSAKVARLCAYYPYSADFPDDGVIMLKSGVYNKSNDISYDTGVRGTGNSTVFFSLKHVYSKLTFNFVRDAYYTGKCNISKISIVSNNVLASNTFSILSGKYGAGVKDTVTVDAGISSILPGDTAVASVLLVPTTDKFDGYIRLSFIIDNKKMDTVINPGLVGITSFKAGENYTLNVNIYNSEE